jgi:fatty-acyl-CoA synthase
MSRVCCPIPTFHIFGEIAGTMNINAPKYFTAYPAILPDTVETMRTVQEEKCTALLGAPIIYRDILAHPRRKEFDMSSLLFGIVGAAPVNPELIEKLEREIPIKTMSQGYGQTENSASMAMSVFAEDDKQRRYLSVGKAMPRLEIKIADSNGRILPIGEEGEICARGFNVMKGYYDDEKKTSEAITPTGWLRTGDVGCMDDQGYIYYRTRQKEMVIIGGINVYPVEIENVLLEHPHIAEAQVFGTPDQRYGEVLCAWIKTKPGTKINDVNEIREFLSSKVAFFKIPKYVKIIETFAPYTTPTGKVQKFKLSETMSKELSATSS